jgi:excinuclease UvrABC nuclease subunit
MNKEFENRVRKLSGLFDSLEKQPMHSICSDSLPKHPAIYVFYDQNKPVHVGRTRNLKRRLDGHLRKSHYTATFAFKETRRLTKNKKATYTSSGSRTALLSDTAFVGVFEEQLNRLRKMSVKYLVINDSVDQYLLELYAALEYGTSLSEFDTH